MTDHPDILSRYRLPWRRDQLKQGSKLGSAMRYAPKNPLLLIGVAILGIGGYLAWRNRDKIAATAGPLIEDAMARGQTLLDEAKVRSQTLLDEAKTQGQGLLDEAKAKGQAVAEKVASVRRGAADENATPELH